MSEEVLCANPFLLCPRAIAGLIPVMVHPTQTSAEERMGDYMSSSNVTAGPDFSLTPRAAPEGLHKLKDKYVLSPTLEGATTVVH
ncbi:hypothetical protein PAMP_001676 [Pampus punctatissimus]